MIWYDMIWYAMILYCMIWYDMMCYYDDIIRKPQRWPSLNDRPVHTNIYSSYTTCIHSIHSIHSVFQPVPMNQTAGDLNTPTRRMRWYDTCLDCCWVLLSVESVDTSEPNATAVQSLGNSRPSLKVERPQARHKQDTSKTQARHNTKSMKSALFSASVFNTGINTAVVYQLCYSSITVVSAQQFVVRGSGSDWAVDRANSRNCLRDQ